jgi:hypothetical protein
MAYSLHKLNITIHDDAISLLPDYHHFHYISFFAGGLMCLHDSIAESTKSLAERTQFAADIHIRQLLLDWHMYVTNEKGSMNFLIRDTADAVDRYTRGSKWRTMIFNIRGSEYVITGYVMDEYEVLTPPKSVTWKLASL